MRNATFAILLICAFIIGSYVPQKQSDYAQSNSGAVDFIKNKPSGSDSTEYYGLYGRVRQIMKVWQDTIVCSTSNGQVVDISSAHFTYISSIQATSFKNTGTVTSVPYASVKSYNTSSVTINIVEGNSSIVSLLGSGVLLGVSNQFANTSGLKLFLTITGY